MDGKAGAESLVNKLLQDPNLMKSLAAMPKPQIALDNDAPVNA